MSDEWVTVASNPLKKATPTGTPTAAPPPLSDEWVTVASKPITAKETLADIPAPDVTDRNFIQRLADAAYLPAGQIIQGATFGFGDEAEAGVRSLLGGDSYDIELKDIRGENKQYFDENPLAAAGYQMGGGVLSALMGSGLLGLGRAAMGSKTAVEAARTAELARRATTLGNIANQVKKGSLIGAGTGAVTGYGTGEGGVVERLKEAGIQGGIGLLAGAGGGAVLGSAESLLQSERAQRMGQSVLNAGRRLVSDEAGAIGDRGRKLADILAPDGTLPKLSEGEAAILDWTKDIPREDLSKGVTRLADALDSGSPMLPSEAVNRPSLYQLARNIRNENRGIDTAEAFLNARKAGTQQRYYDAFDVVAPGDQTPLEGQLGLREAMKGKIEELDTARKSLTKPFYDKAREGAPIIKSQTVDTLIEQEPELQKAIKEVRRFGETLDGEKVADLADTSLPILQGAKKRIDQKVADALGKNPPDREMAAQYMRIKEKLTTALKDASPNFKDAEEAFANASGSINYLAGSDKQRGIFEGFINIRDENASQIGSKLFRLAPQQIGEIKDALGPENAEKFARGVRAHLQDLVENRKDGFEQLVSLTKTDAGRKKLEVAIGNEGYEKLKTFLDKEALIKEGDRRYFQGSPTQSAQEVEKKRKGMVNRLKTLIRGFGSNPVELAADGLDAVLTQAPTADDMIVKQLAEILFKPEQGLQSFGNIARYRNIREPYLANVRGAMQGARQTLIPGISAVDKNK